MIFLRAFEKEALSTLGKAISFGAPAVGVPIAYAVGKKVSDVKKRQKDLEKQLDSQKRINEAMRQKMYLERANRANFGAGEE